MRHGTSPERDRARGVIARALRDERYCNRVRPARPLSGAGSARVEDVGDEGSGPPDGVRVRYWAAARAAAGVAEEHVVGAELGSVLAAVRRAHPGPAFERLLAACSLLVDGVPLGHRDPAEVPLTPGTTVEVLPPYAGG